MAGNRDIIGQAKGILMARAGISDDEAFDLLRKASQRLNIELAVVAEQVATGTTVPKVSDPAAN
jgi:AmiR/NasT family two-component response regulator